MDVAEHLDQGSVLVSDLPGSQLGAFENGSLVVDLDAGGQGWFIDATPQSNEEFAGGVAADDSPAAGRVDLLTALLHQMGHLLGLEDVEDADELMSVELAAGVRKDPALVAVDAVFSDDFQA
jgi:hypothetical protein